ncbi:MAG: hypothetical protein LUH82_04670 [Clostridiales bacterium]|nr:hypothetical protein [Clostridiales bacterium]
MKKKLKKIQALLFAAAMLICTMVPFAASADSSQQTQATANTFTPAAAASITINETFDKNTWVKSNVSVTNDAATGYSTYIRVLIGVSWVNDADGSVLALNDVDTTGYKLTLNTDDTDSDGGYWAEGRDGYYYYTLPVEAGATTEVLITQCYATSEIDGYHLEVQIIAQAVQSAGELDSGTAFVKNNWGVTVAADNSISKPLDPLA